MAKCRTFKQKPEFPAIIMRGFIKQRRWNILVFSYLLTKKDLDIRLDNLSKSVSRELLNE